MVKLACITAALILASGPAFAESTPQGGPSVPQDKVVCKRFAPVGSLARSRRVCKSEREWQEEREVARAEGKRLTEQMSGDREQPEFRPPGTPQS